MNLQTACRECLERPSAEPAILHEGRWYTRGEIRALADQLIALLDEADVPTEAVVCLVPRNRPSAIAAEIALLASKRTIRMIYAYQSPAGVARDLERGGLGAVIVAEQDVAPEIVDAARRGGFAAIALREMAARTLPGAEKYCCSKAVEEGAGAPCIQILTSGTTGPPKNITLSYDQVFDLVKDSLLRPAGNSIGADIPALLYFPLANHSGIYSVLPPILSGQQAVLLDRFTLEGWLDFVGRFRPAITSAPPAAVRMILDADVPPKALGSVKALMTGAAPLDPNTQRNFEEKYGIPILLSYGATEFNGPVTMMTLELYDEFGSRKLGSVGRPLKGVRLRVVDPESGEELLRGEEGLLEVISPRMGPHWIRTSDIGRIDDDGFVFHCGRADGAIVRGGFKILPDVVERALMLHPGVAAASVVGIPDPKLGQVPAAVIQLKAGAEIVTAQALERHVREHVYATHVPVEWRFVDGLPRTPSYKVDLRAIRGLFTVTEG